jgi:uncharacterized MAPEG superfamily protein
MTVEIRMLACTIVLGLVYVMLAGALGTAQRGLLWNLGNRDGEVKPLAGPAARAWRASWNFLESFPFFAAAVLAVLVSNRATAATALGSQLYFWGRLVYLPVYVIGLPYLRTLIWAVSFAGLVMVLAALF